MSSRVLLVEDEPGLVLTLTDLLEAEGYVVESAVDGPSGLAKASGGLFDLVILDVMLPGKNGLDVCRELRQRGKDVAVLMLTAKSQLFDRVVGLKLGADDYLTKPFEPPELLARVEALLRRVKKEKLTPVIRFHFGDIDIDFEKGDVRKRGEPVGLAGKELELLRYLIDRRGKVVSRDELLEEV
jgi:two-component system alkaline phosphatase synthesis response regulator PhoP